MKTRGSHGSSEIDANEWRRILTSFKSTSNEICKSLAKLTILIATHELCFLDKYNSSRLIPLNKCPSVRPMGFNEVMQRIISRAIVTCVKMTSSSSEVISNFAFVKEAELNMPFTLYLRSSGNRRHKLSSLLMQKMPSTV